LKQNSTKLRWHVTYQHYLFTCFERDLYCFLWPQSDKSASRFVCPHFIPVCFWRHLVFFFKEYACVISFRAACYILSGPRLPPWRGLGPSNNYGTRTRNFAFTLRKWRVPCLKIWSACHYLRVPCQKWV
jgi:hypothetical protein